MQVADPDWSKDRVTSGLSSGEGLIKAADRESGGALFVHEGEFAKTLKVASREGNVLSEVLRLAWDSGNLQVMTKDPLKVSGAHVSIVGHITEEELRSTLTGLQAANGFANRFLLICAKRARLLATGGNLDDQAIAELGAKVGAALESARRLQILRRSSAADELWTRRYHDLAADTPGGMLGALTARSEAQLLRLSVAYAVLAGSRTIEPEHLDAAWALWSYTRDSAAYLFGNQLGDPMAERLLRAFETAPDRQFTRKELTKASGGHLYGDNLDRVLCRLEDGALIQRIMIPTGGRPGVVFMKAPQ
jgi:hypothetical protein